MNKRSDKKNLWRVITHYRFIKSVAKEFQKSKKCGDESFQISSSLFKITKPFISTEIPYCEVNEINSKYFFAEISQIH